MLVWHRREPLSVDKCSRNAKREYIIDAMVEMHWIAQQLSRCVLTRYLCSVAWSAFRSISDA